MEHKTISSMLGMADNLHEPIPLANKPATILGVSISLQVRATHSASVPSRVHEGSWKTSNELEAFEQLN